MPFVPPVPGAHLPGVMRCSRWRTAGVWPATEAGEDVVIIGGGPIGLETAPAFLDAGARLTIIERMPQVMPSALDPDMATLMQEHLKKMGAWIITGKGVDAINGAAAVESVTCGGETIPADLVLLSAGVRPNTDLAVKAGIETGVTGGIVVDEYFRVRRNGQVMEDVLAAGDCAEVKSVITGKPVICAVGSVANRQANLRRRLPHGQEAALPGGAVPDGLRHRRPARRQRRPDHAEAASRPASRRSPSGRRAPPGRAITRAGRPSTSS